MSNSKIVSSLLVLSLYIGLSSCGSEGEKTGINSTDNTRKKKDSLPGSGQETTFNKNTTKEALITPYRPVKIDTTAR